VFGENRKLITLSCPVCKKHVALRVDPEDVARHTKDGVFVQVAFADRTGRPYLSAAERELFLTCCGDCWNALCSSDPLAYS